ncbi:MAG: 16S rRNA (cytosine(967)-C(5))-methyltransferase RsmB [Rickettsiales bacterium]|nr:16S rRNA (cytosine(967)-C(5))-methyltransferase RsmB [Rickettsiales bacterium]
MDINQMTDALKSRKAAIAMLQRVIDKQMPLDVAIEHLDEVGLSGSDRGFARILLMQTLRYGRAIDALLEGYLSQPYAEQKPELLHVLRVGAVQLLILQTPAHAAVHTSVELARAVGVGRQSKLVNAILNRVVREGEKDFAAIDAARVSLPDWLWQEWAEHYGEETVHAIATAQMLEPPLDIYVPQDVDVWAIKLEAHAINDHVLRLPNQPVQSMDGYDEGAWWVQDVAASLPVQLLGDVAGQTVLDVCAAPGGKTAQLISLGAEVVALDRSRNRMKRFKENMVRLNMSAETVISDVMDWQPEELHSHILLDAPCSATGTIRRHPDLLYQKTPEDIEHMQTIQSRMLDHVWGWLQPGGVMIYCVCAINACEGEDQIAAFLDRTADATLVPINADEMPEQWIKDGMLRTLPQRALHEGGMDGFFAARLTKSANS